MVAEKKPSLIKSLYSNFNNTQSKFDNSRKEKFDIFFIISKNIRNLNNKAYKIGHSLDPHHKQLILKQTPNNCIKS